MKIKRYKRSFARRKAFTLLGAIVCLILIAIGVSALVAIVEVVVSAIHRIAPPDNSPLPMPPRTNNIVAMRMVDVKLEVATSPEGLVPNNKYFYELVDGSWNLFYIAPMQTHDAIEFLTEVARWKASFTNAADVGFFKVTEEAPVVSSSLPVTSTTNSVND